MSVIDTVVILETQSKDKRSVLVDIVSQLGYSWLLIRTVIVACLQAAGKKHERQIDLITSTYFYEDHYYSSIAILHVRFDHQTRVQWNTYAVRYAMCRN